MEKGLRDRTRTAWKPVIGKEKQGDVKNAKRSGFQFLTYGCTKGA